MDRRKFVTGASALFCAPAIIKADAQNAITSGRERPILLKNSNYFNQAKPFAI